MSVCGSGASPASQTCDRVLTSLPHQGRQVGSTGGVGPTCSWTTRAVKWSVALALAVAAAVVPATAAADTGTFSGTLTPNSCGPLQPITVAPGETTIDIAAAATIAANDITIDLLDSQGRVVEHGDTLTSPEEIHYYNASLPAGIYSARVCPFTGGLVAPPYTYTGTYSTGNAPGVVPGSTWGGAGGTPTPTRVAGNLQFAPATIVDAQRTEGEPLNFIDPNGTYWESGPWGTTTQNSFIHRSTDGGLEFHVVSPAGIRPDPGPGGGDTDIIADDQGNHYFVDLEALVNLGTSVSNDNGDTWRKNPVAVENTAVDRQWLAVDNGTTSSAADNTVFLAFHQSAVGTFIYSSPGSTGPTDQVGGLVWQNSSAAAPLPLGSDSTCGQLRFDAKTRNLYYGCVIGDHVRVTIGHVAPGQRTGIQYRNVNAPPSPGGGDVGHLFPAVATDDAGNLYAAWIDETDNNVYYSSSSDAGTTWTTPIKVNSPPAVTNEFLWAQGGSAGTLALAWLGTETAGQPDDFPNWADDPNGAPSVKWYGYEATITSAASLKPTIAQQRFTEKPTHFGQICNQGIGCTTSGGDRTMADYFGFSLDRQDAMRVVMNDTTNQHHGAELIEVRQLGPKTLHGGKLARATPANPMGDPTSDANWPHYSPTGAGPNQPQLDFTNVAVSQPNSGTLRVRMTLSSLSSLTPPAGKTSAAWIARFGTLSTGDFGEQSYPTFYVGAESTGGGAPTYFAGSTACTETLPGTCKVVTYPATLPAQGKICGNTIQVDVPLSGFGRALTGGTLYSLTAFSFGRSGETDLYADVDASRSFDYALGSNVSSAGC